MTLDNSILGRRPRVKVLACFDLIALLVFERFLGASISSAWIDRDDIVFFLAFAALPLRNMKERGEESHDCCWRDFKHCWRDPFDMVKMHTWRLD